MITDARVLQPEFIPREVKHRDGEVNHLSSVLRPILNDDQPDPAFLYGSTGVGKTCIAQFTVEQLREHMPELNKQYVNCWEHYSGFKTLYTILEGIDETIDIHRQSTPKDVLIDRLRDYNGPPYVVILDEVDQLEDKTLLYDLYRIPELTMVLIANTEQGLFAGVDDRLNSRLTDTAHIHFRGYDTEELVTILQDRVRWGLSPDAIDEARLQTIASYAGGDARVAISILRKAARTAKKQLYDEIPDTVIRKVVSEAKAEIRQKAVDQLKAHQQVLYQIITEHGEIRPQELREEYAKRVDDPLTNRMVRNYLSKLEHYHLIKSEGNTKARVYHTVR